MKKFMKKTEGFTLVELIVVIAILGILAGVGTVGYSGYIKKANEAADNQLLGTINHAFAVACIENGVDASTLTSATMPLKADKTVDIENITPAEHQINFAKYYAGNESAAFKVAEYLRFVNGVFMVGEGENIYNVLLEILAAQTGDINAVKESAFYKADGLGVNGLMNKVGSLTDMLGSVTVWPTYDADGNPTSAGNGAYQLLVGYAPELMETLGVEKFDALVQQKINLMAAADPNGFGKIEDEAVREQLAHNALLSNYAVIQAAEKMTDTTVDETLEKLRDPNTNFVTIMKEDSSTGVTQAALAYGLYTAYAYSIEDPATRAAAIKNAEDPTSLLKSFNDEGFRTYLNGTKAQDDVAGYVAAMNMINSSSDNKDALGSLMVNGFNDPALGSVLQQVMGK